jgi:peptidyl-prolyl cis-trans isomerase C
MKTVLSNEAERHKIEVTDAEITDAIREVRERLQQQGTSLEAVMQKEQIAESELRANLKGELRIKKLVELNVSTNLTPTAAEIDEFYAAQKANFQTPESVHARHILVKFGEKDDAKAKAEKKAKAESLQKKLVEGADFAQVARENSEDVSNKDRGGDLGTFGRGQMVPEFETAAFGQATNEIGPVIETMFGYHIVQVLEHQPASEMAADEAKEKIVAFLKRKLEQEAFKSFIDALKAKAKIVYASEELRPMESGMRAPGARMAPASGQPAGGAAPVPAPAAQAAAAPAATPVPAPGAKVESAAPSPAAAPAPATTTATP